MEKTQFRHVKTGKVIWATAQWVKLTQEMRQMHLWEKMDATQTAAKLKFEVPGVMPAVEPTHEVVEVESEPQTTIEQTHEVEPATEVAQEPIEFQQNIVADKPKKSNKK